MALARKNFAITDEDGNVIDGATVTVTTEGVGALASLFSNTEGTVGLGNPYVAASGADAGFFTSDSVVRIDAVKGDFSRTWRYEPIGNVISDPTVGVDPVAAVPGKFIDSIDVDGTAHLNDVDFLDLLNIETGVAADDYGDAAHVLILSVDQYGRITAVSAVALDSPTVSNLLAVVSTDAGASVGPPLYLKRDSASPANADYGGYLVYLMNNGAGTAKEVARITAKWLDVTASSEDAAQVFAAIVGGTLTENFYAWRGLYAVGATGGDEGPGTGNFKGLYEDGSRMARLDSPVFTGFVKLVSTDAGSSPDPIHYLHRDSASPANGDYGGAISYLMNNASGTAKEAARITVKWIDTGNGTEDAVLVMSASVAGTLTENFYYGQGQYALTATGGDQGTGTINAKGLYEDGVRALTAAGNRTMTGGVDVTTTDSGTKSSGTFTPAPKTNNFQKIVNGGAFTLAPPATDCSMVLKITNNGSAGAITASGFTIVKGDALDTTNGSVFVCTMTVIDSTSILDICKVS